MPVKLTVLMLELEHRENRLADLQDSYLKSVREEMEFANFDQGISEHYAFAIEHVEKAIISIQKDIDAIEGNEVFVSRFGQQLHDLYKKDNPGFDKFTKLENVETSGSSWCYLVPGEPVEMPFVDGYISAVMPASAFPKREEAQFTTYKNKSLYVCLAFAPEINTVFVRR